jgi:5'-deoxynucleotidase YfbR-like HD superfamily hydrolase
MEDFNRLFNLLELTRSMPQSGYALLGLPKDQLSDLAQHQYLVAMIAWQLARGANRAGANLNVEKVLELALVHDLGELFGGDIAMPYGHANKKAKKLAKAFEEENLKYLSKFFGDDKKYVAKIFEEIKEHKTDEGIVAKLADYIECSHYRLYMNAVDKNDQEFNLEKINGFLKKMKDPAAKKYLSECVESWHKNFFKTQGRTNIMRSFWE